MIINEREKDLKNLLEKQHAQEIQYNEIIDNLKTEISSPKENILNLKNNNNNLEHDLELFARNLDNIKKDSNSYFHTIKMLENQNMNMAKENDDLKLEISKLERILYGKTRKY